MGFSYADWAGTFYPAGVKPADYLAHYARHFDALELDTTFHAVPPPERFRRWAEAVPDGFRFSVKAPRAVTHDAPIDSARDPILRFLDVARHLGPKLGVVLIQFPPSFSARNLAGVETLLTHLPADLRYAVEFRHPSWLSADLLAAASILRERRAALVIADHQDAPTPIVPTADLLYLRFLGTHERFPYLGREELDMTDRLRWWLDELRPALADAREAYAFFNNDYAGFAPATAKRLQRLLGRPAAPLPPPQPPGLFG